MKKADIIIKNAYLLSMNARREVNADACIAIVKDRIAAVGGREIMEEYSAARVIDAAGKIVLPGFISTHSHLFQTMLKGLGRDKDLMGWLDNSIRIAARHFTRETVYYAALCGCIEAIRSGTTTILDYMYNHAEPGMDEEVIRAFEELGIRGILGRSYANVGKYPPERAFRHIETEQDFLDETRRLEKKYRGHSRIGVAIAPGIIWDHTDDGFREMRRMANELHIPITLHIVETPDDDAFSLKNYGERAIPHLEKLGLFGPDFIGVHCVNMTDEDFAIFKQYDVKISHNPASNMILASGVPPIKRFVEEGFTVSLACDGSASGDTQNFLEVLKLSSLLQKVYTRDPKVIPAATALEMATLGGAKSLGREADLGSVEAGKKADLIFFDPSTIFSVPSYDPVAAIVYASTPASIRSVMVDGEMVLENGSICRVDEEKVRYEARRLGVELVEKAGLSNTQWGQKMPYPKW